MLTQQEALEAMAGRSPEGKPLVFVSQQDYAALSKKHEELLSAVRKQRAYLKWLLLALAGVIAVVAFAAVGMRQTSAAGSVEPFGRYFFTSYDAAGVRAENAFCAVKNEGRQLKPLNVSGAGLVFECI
jgi:hypothetical protein